MAEIEIRALDRDALAQLAALPYSLSIAFGERGLGAVERDAVLRPLRPGDRRLDVAEVELERVGEHRVGRVAVAPHALRLGA